MNRRTGFSALAGLAVAVFGTLTIGQVSHTGNMKADDALALRTMGPKERVGKLLFEDTNLSQPAGQACASCHASELAFTDPDHGAPTSQGVNPALSGNRNSPSAMYMAFSPAFQFDEREMLYLGGQFWDGRAATLEEQAKEPFLNPIEMANQSKLQVLDKVRAAKYAPLFQAVYGRTIFNDTDAAYDRIADAIAAFERTRSFNRFTSKYDAYLAGRTKLTPQETRGLQLFEASDKGNCAACHPLAASAEGTPGLGTDFTYDNLGVPKNPNNAFYRMPAQFNPNGWRFVDRGLGGFVGRTSEDGKFKVPTVRNVASTAPYMHNGYFSSLRAVVDFYNTRDVKPRCAEEFVAQDQALARGCWPRPEVGANVNADELGNLKLSSQDVDDIVAFMLTLTDGWSRRPSN